MTDSFDFAQEEARKSDLLLQAALLRDQGELEQASERFAAAAEIEERLAEDAEARNDLEKALRLRYSAASGWAHAGDFHHALALLRALEARADTPAALRTRIHAFAERVQKQRARWHRSLRETALA
jgi:hypothetical protein